jgi:hypothetical protein
MEEKKKKKTYTPAPEVPEDLMTRYSVMLSVLSGAMTMSDGARELAMSRNHFQTLMHRALHGFVDGLSPKLPGRPSRPEAEQKLMEENERLRRENEQLNQRVDSIERMLGVASDLLRSRAAPRPRASRQTSTTTKKDPSNDDDNGPVERASRLRVMGLNATLIAAVVGVGASTLRRWRSHGLPHRKPPMVRPIDARLVERVDLHVRELRGLVGAESIRRTITGVSRRQAAMLKRETLTAMERERIARADRIVVTAAGIVRGFDQMYVDTTEGQQLLLFSNDGAVPYRTSVMRTEHYDEAAVAKAVAHDFELHGAPLVWRADRHKSHDAPAVRAILHEHGVLRLFGPPRHPNFYGQTERGNREHRAFLNMLGVATPSEIDDECARMLVALNGVWKRRTLQWRTANDVWSTRPRLEVDRGELRGEVADRAERIRRNRGGCTLPEDLVQRLAIEGVLVQRGWLRREAGSRC